jgi:hypothetical protein
MKRSAARTVELYPRDTRMRACDMRTRRPESKEYIHGQPSVDRRAADQWRAG